MAISAPLLFGGVCVLGSSATRLSDEDTPMSQLTIRGSVSNSAEIVYIGNSDVSSNNAHAFLEKKEAFTWGPYTRGGGIRPSQVFLLGSVGDRVMWSGFPA